MGGGLPKDLRPMAAVVVIGAIMSILDTTIVNVALQTLRIDLDVPLSTIQWVSTAYLLSLATVIPLTGWMAERFGARRVWMGAVAAFTVTSALCGLAWSAESLIGFRVLQGLAGGMIMPIGMITLAQAAGPQRMGRVMSVIGVPMVLAPVVGPVIGGLLVDHLSWRWIFYVNVPVGIIGLAMASRMLPAGVAVGRKLAEGVKRPPLDWIGLLLLSPGVALVVFGLSEIGTHGTVEATAVWLPLAVGAVMVGAFVVHGFRSPNPLVDVTLLRGRGFSAAAATCFLLGAALFGALMLLPLYFQVARGESAVVAGLLMMPQGVGAALGMNIGGRLTDRYGAGAVVPVGLLIMAAATVPFVFVDGDTPYWLLSVALLVRGFSLGGTMMPAMAGAYATLESSQVPRATPLLNVIQRVGGSLGVAILTVILQNSISSEVGRAGASGGESAIGVFPENVRAQIADALGHAFGNAYLWALIGSLVALIPALMLFREERRIRREKAEKDEQVVEVPSEIPNAEAVAL